MRIIAHSDDPMWCTGFGTQIHNLLWRLKKARPEWELGVLHWNHKGKPFTSAFGYQLLTDVTGHHHDNAKWNIEHYQPDLYLTLYDLFISGPLMHGLSQKAGLQHKPPEERKTKWVNWFVYDMLRWSSPHAWRSYMKSCDVPVAMSQYGQESVLENYGTKAYMIYHGVDPKQFPPIEKDKLQERKEKLGNPDFIMGALFRNIKRKQTARLLEAWSHVCREYRDVKLLLNNRPDDPEGCNVSLYMHHFNLGAPTVETSPILFGQQLSPLLGVPPDELNMNYQLCDAQVLPTQGEGFGIPLIEGYQSNGLPVIMTNCSTYPELVGDHGLPIQTDGYEWTNQAGAMPLPSTESLEEQMRIMIDDRKLRVKFQQANREFVKQFDFETEIIPQWLALIERICPDSKPVEKPKIVEVPKIEA